VYTCLLQRAIDDSILSSSAAAAALSHNTHDRISSNAVGVPGTGAALEAAACTFLSPGHGPLWWDVGTAKMLEGSLSLSAPHGPQGASAFSIKPPKDHCAPSLLRLQNRTHEDTHALCLGRCVARPTQGASAFRTQEVLGGVLRQGGEVR